MISTSLSSLSLSRAVARTSSRPVRLNTSRATIPLAYRGFLETTAKKDVQLASLEPNKGLPIYTFFLVQSIFYSLISAATFNLPSRTACRGIFLCRLVGEECIGRLIAQACATPGSEAYGSDLQLSLQLLKLMRIITPVFIDLLHRPKTAPAPDRRIFSQHRASD